MFSKIKFPSACLIIIFLFLSVSVSAQTNWFFVALNSDGNTTFIDRDFMRLPNGFMRVWQKTLSPDKTFTLRLMEWNCPQKNFRFLRSLTYAPDGSAIARSDEPTAWRSFVPDSTGMFLYRDVCDASLKVNSNDQPVEKPGALFARVIVREASLRREADSNSEVIRKFSFGERLILLDESPIGTWRQVADTRNKLQGWLNGNDFEIVKAKKPVRRAKSVKIK